MGPCHTRGYRLFKKIKNKKNQTRGVEFFVKVVVHRCKIEREEFGKGVVCVVCAQVEEEYMSCVEVVEVHSCSSSRACHNCQLSMPTYIHVLCIVNCQEKEK